MPLYLDVHREMDATPEAIERAHLDDLEAQDRYGVKYLKYWFDQEGRRVCCLVEGPSPEACAAVHREAHGAVADEIIEVESKMVEAFLGGQQPPCRWPRGSGASVGRAGSRSPTWSAS